MLALLSQMRSELPELLPYLTSQEREELERLIGERPWMALSGPQTHALLTDADVLFYGGAAGGGKTDLLCGLALTEHQRSIIYRREGSQLHGIFQRVEEIVGTRDGFNSQDKIWRLPDGRVLEFGSCPNLGDERRYQGRPHDFIGFDEIPHFLQSQFRFLMGWLRSTDPTQRCRVVCAGNPPTGVDDADWLIDYFGPWLNPQHPNPAGPGEIRYFATIEGKDVEVEAGTLDVDGHEVEPRSRTFIPARVEDNPYLLGTGYRDQLESLPEPLRSQMLLGDFQAGGEDHLWQIIPSAWVDAAMARWEKLKSPGYMTSMGIDPARGGPDESVFACRYGDWVDTLKAIPGPQTADGPAVAGQAIGMVRNKAPIHVDVIGIGSSVYDHLKDGYQTVGVNWAEGSTEKSKEGKLGFKNLRAQHWWRMREALDPANGRDLALPP